ncbi:MAG: hypothetical protein K8J08_13215 [Thermoanaerobaculia bacterium]|nr:hypothetical protein [Thermoanaerobaculia bacterium]
MELLNYLDANFLTRRQLLEISQTTEEQLQKWIELSIAPRSSYRLDLSVSCDSYFGDHQGSESVEYFAKGTLSWLGFLREIASPGDAFLAFERRYKARLDNLRASGFRSDSPKLNEGIEAHIASEWGHFLDGVYGLCTRSGLPEDIAAKEFAVVITQELIERSDLTERELEDLAAAVDLLDAASADFAPHEREQSSRRRLVDDVRRRYRL